MNQEQQRYETLIASGDISGADGLAADCGEADSEALARIAKVLDANRNLSPHAVVGQIEKIVTEREATEHLLIASLV